MLAIWNGLRLIQAFFFWNALKGYDASPLYISISGGAWFIIGMVLTWSLWQGKAWGRMAAIGAAAGYTSWYWFDRLVMQEPHANKMFVLTANVFFLLIIPLILFSNRTRRYFKKEPYEH